MADRTAPKQLCPHCGKPFTAGAGLARHKSACQYKAAGTVIDLMALLQDSLKGKRTLPTHSNGGEK